MTLKFNIKIILLFLVLNINQAFSQKYFHVKYSKAKKEAKTTHKPLFIDFSATWCKPCREMENEVFTDPKVEKYLQENYVCLKVYSDKDRKIFTKYNVDRYPTFIILSNQKEIHRWSGSSSVNSFLNILTTLKKSLDIDEDNVDLFERYNMMCTIRAEDEAKHLAQEILSRDTNWLEKKYMNIILDNLVSDTYRQYYIMHKNTFREAIDSSLLSRKINNYYFRKNLPNYVRKDKIPIEKIRIEFIQLFGEKYYKYHFQRFLLHVLFDKKGYGNSYEKILLDVVSNNPNLFSNPFYYYKLEYYILHLRNKKKIETLYSAFLYQMTFDEIILNFFDLKACLEYQLGMKDKIKPTLASAEILSQRTYHESFKSNYKKLRRKLRKKLF